MWYGMIWLYGFVRNWSPFQDSNGGKPGFKKHMGIIAEKSEPKRSLLGLGPAVNFCLEKGPKSFHF